MEDQLSDLASSILSITFLDKSLLVYVFIWCTCVLGVSSPVLTFFPAVLSVIFKITWTALSGTRTLKMDMHIRPHPLHPNPRTTCIARQNFLRTVWLANILTWTNKTDLTLMICELCVHFQNFSNFWESNSNISFQSLCFSPILVASYKQSSLYLVSIPNPN